MLTVERRCRWRTEIPSDTDARVDAAWPQPRSATALAMVETSLAAMASGGLYDNSAVDLLVTALTRSGKSRLRKDALRPSWAHSSVSPRVAITGDERWRQSSMNQCVVLRDLALPNGGIAVQKMPTLRAKKKVLRVLKIRIRRHRCEHRQQQLLGMAE